MSHFL